MADLLPDGIHNTVFPTLDTFGRSTSILENPTDLEQATISTTGPHTPPAEEPRPPDQHSLLNRLLEIQPQLLKLVLRFSERSNTTDDVEDIYRVTETMVSIMDQMEGERLQRVPGKGFDFNGIGVLVMSGCYFSLIQAYQYLADMLSERASAASAPGTGDMADSSLPCLQKMSVPTISVGGLRLAMSRKAAAEVNLHLVAHTVYYLKDALQKCAKRMDKRRSSQRSCYDGLLDLDGGPLEGHGKMKTMVCQAVDRLNEGEEKLLDHLHTIVGASNNRIFRMG